ncbi:hypothetical protein GE118_00940 [Mycoplasma sp. NEAQ87857]|nr:hypothetical protein GE118_00940 [Mycoplasma sp. NEAQ87857]
MKKLDNKQLNDLTPGFAITGLITAIGAIATAVTPIVGLIKTATAPTGEIKDKNATYKWEMPTPKVVKPTVDNYITF